MSPSATWGRKISVPISYASTYNWKTGTKHNLRCTAVQYTGFYKLLEGEAELQLTFDFVTRETQGGQDTVSEHFQQDEGKARKQPCHCAVPRTVFSAYTFPNGFLQVFPRLRDKVSENAGKTIYL